MKGFEEDGQQQQKMQEDDDCHMETTIRERVEDREERKREYEARGPTCSENSAILTLCAACHLREAV